MNGLPAAVGPSKPGRSSRGLLATARVRGLARHGWAVWLSAVILLVAAVAVIAGPLFAPHDPDAVSLSDAYSGLSSAHLLGADASGRDLLSRLVIGARSTVLGPLAVAVIATLLGVGLALVMSWRGGLVDFAASRILDVMFAFPGLLAAVLAVAVFGKGLQAPIIALAIVNLPYIARVIRAASLKERSLPYVASLTVQGLSSGRIVLRHILPNIGSVVAAQAVISFSYALIDLAAINYLGMGIQPPTSDWGLMVAEGQSSILAGHSAESLLAGLCIVAVIISVNVIAEQFSDDARMPV